MSKRTPAQVYAQLIDAGFTADQATVMTAIAGAESGYDNAALGDVQLQTGTWGPSFGLFQIRTVKTDTGRGTDRDISRLASSDAEQARAAYDISRHGTDFSPWSVYSTGRYQAFLPAAQGAATTATAATGDGPLPTIGPSWLPWNWGADAGNAIYGQTLAQTLGGVRTIALEGGFVLLGLALVGGGLALMLRPQIAAASRWAVGKAKTAARLAVIA